MLKRFVKIIPKTECKENIDRLFSELLRYEPLPKEEEHEIFRKWKATGDQKYKDKLVNHNLRFVVSLAKTYQGKTTVDVLDLFNEGVIGFMRGIDKFDPSRGVKLYSYCAQWARKYVIEAVIDKNQVRDPSSRANLRHHLNKYIDRFYSKNERYPTEEEAAEEFEGQHTEDYIIQRYRETIRLGDYEDLHIEGDIEFEQESNDILDIAKEVLNEIEYEVACMTFGMDGSPQYDYDIILEKLGYTDAQYMGIYDSMIDKMEKELKNAFI